MSPTVKRYFHEHGFTAKLARDFGVVVSGAAIHYRCFDGAGAFFRTRDLDAERKATRQPKRRKLDVCYFKGKPSAAQRIDLLVCEGEPDALAAEQARREPGTRFAASALVRLRVAFLPGTATPAHKVIAEVERLQPRDVYLAFDGDYAGHAAAERIFEERAGHYMHARKANFTRLPIPEGQDLADVLAANRGGDTLGSLIASAA